jgi:Predicted periplasmic protein (DUF2092)
MTMLTTRNLMASVGLCVAGFGCQRGSPPDSAAAEPPPPLIEPELGAGSRLVDPRADELVRQTSERLARAGEFALEAEEVYDDVPDQSPRRQLTDLCRVAMRRPDRLVGDTSGDAMNRTFWYDGKVFSALERSRTCGRAAPYATIEGSAKTSTGREASADLVADLNRVAA